MTDRAVRRRVLSWAFYDWANSAFATTVMAGFFPAFFKAEWNVGVAETVSTFRLGTANAIAGLVVAAAAPLLGAIADRGGAKKTLLVFFALLGIVMTGGLYFVERGQWFTAAALFVCATVGFMGANVFYDSLIVGVLDPDAGGKTNADRVSAFGFALGYLGGGLLFAVNVAMVLKFEAFGFADKGEAVRASFVSVAVWWAVFSIPLLVGVAEPCVPDSAKGLRAVTAGLRQLGATFREIRRLRHVGLFLAGYFLYIDGVDTVIRMAVDYGMSLGFPSDSLIVALLITQFVGFPAALVFGRIGERLGTRRGIFIGLAVYIAVTTWGAFMTELWEFYGLAIVVGLVQGGVQSLSRALYTRLIPPGKAAEFFGFYNMLGKFAAVIGPFLVGWVGVMTGSSRLGILSILILFIAGAVLLARVDEARGHEAARAL